MRNTIYVVNFSKNYHRNIKNNYIFNNSLKIRHA